MRAGGCTLQQGLTSEAASVVKQAVSLARRRGHAQVTPLHVASTMLSAAEGLLRKACLQSHSHPLQCRALELCFNVALNRLPASNSSPILGGVHHSQNPSISNALIAAFKRAQAHQRRGSIESQQQPLLAVKIELEQLIISILDDPSVSRVMREAGFSSTHVKSNVEQAVSLEIGSQTSTVASNNNKPKESHDVEIAVTSGDNIVSPVRVEDVKSLVEFLASKKRKSVVVVGESISDIEGVVRVVIEKFERQDVPEGLREVRFVSIPQLLSLSSKDFTRVDVEQKIGEVKSLLRTCVAKGVVLYLGDLKWATEDRASFGGDVCNNNNNNNIQQGRGYYCPVEHMIMEIGKLVCEIGEKIERFWLMGIATFQTYMRCKSGRYSLEAIWGIYPLTIPAGSLRLSLLTIQSDLISDESTNKTNGTTKSLVVEGIFNNGDQYHQNKLTCCADCSAKFDVEARNLQSSNGSESTTSNLPAWLQQCRNESKGLSRSSNLDFQNCVTISDLYKKWNSYCSSTHPQQQQQQINNHFSEKTLIKFSSVSPNSSSASGFTYDHHHHYHNNHQNPNHDHRFWEPSDHQNPKKSYNEPSLRMYFPENKENNHNIIPSSKQPITSLFAPKNPNSNPNSASSSDVMEAEYSLKFKELNSENLKALSTALERKVPWQRDIIPEIATAILKCRSGLTRSPKGKPFNRTKEETWLLFQGVDVGAKEKIARELARLVFGSQDELVSIALSSFSSTRADSTEDYGRVSNANNNNNNKRSRDEQSCSYIERFSEAVSSNPHRVFFVEDVEQADYCSQMGFKRAIERGKVSNSSGEEVELRDAIVILSCESFSSRSRACSPTIIKRIDQPREEDFRQDIDDTTSPCLSLDLNISFDEEDVDYDQSIDDIGLLESVDKRIVFKIQEL